MNKLISLFQAFIDAIFANSDYRKIMSGQAYAVSTGTQSISLDMTSITTSWAIAGYYTPTADGVIELYARMNNASSSMIIDGENAFKVSGAYSIGGQYPLSVIVKKGYQVRFAGGYLTEIQARFYPSEGYAS